MERIQTKIHKILTTIQIVLKQNQSTLIFQKSSSYNIVLIKRYSRYFAVLKQILAHECHFYKIYQDWIYKLSAWVFIYQGLFKRNSSYFKTYQEVIQSKPMLTMLTGQTAWTGFVQDLSTSGAAYSYKRKFLTKIENHPVGLDLIQLKPNVFLPGRKWLWCRVCHHHMAKTTQGWT